MSDLDRNVAYVLGHTLYLNITNRCPCACDFCIRTHSKSVGSGDNLWLDREPTQTEIMVALSHYDSRVGLLRVWRTHLPPGRSVMGLQKGSCPAGYTHPGQHQWIVRSHQRPEYGKLFPGAGGYDLCQPKRVHAGGVCGALPS